MINNTVLLIYFLDCKIKNELSRSNDMSHFSVHNILATRIKPRKPKKRVKKKEKHEVEVPSRMMEWSLPAPHHLNIDVAYLYSEWKY